VRCENDPRESGGGELPFVVAIEQAMNSATRSRVCRIRHDCWVCCDHRTRPSGDRLWHQVPYGTV